MGFAFLPLVLLLIPLSVQAEDSLKHKTQPERPLDPMNRPMDELGITGHDTTLCSDRWNTCSSYDRQQFDQKYPGQPLKDLLRYGEPDWPDKPREGQGRQDFLDDHDRLDQD